MRLFRHGNVCLISEQVMYRRREPARIHPRAAARGTPIAFDRCMMKPSSVAFYREVLRALTRSDVPFLIGGAFAFARHTGIDRRTKDLDLMIEERTWPQLARVLRA